MRRILPGSPLPPTTMDGIIRCPAGLHSSEGPRQLPRLTHLPLRTTTDHARARSISPAARFCGPPWTSAAAVPPGPVPPWGAGEAAKSGTPLGIDNFAVRAMGWKAPQLIEYAAGLEVDILFITDLDAFESLETKALLPIRRRADDAGLKIYLGSWSILSDSRPRSATTVGPPRSTSGSGSRPPRTSVRR